MTREKAVSIIESKPSTAWMAFGIKRFNDGYRIVTGSEIKRHPHMDFEMIKKGELFPGHPIMDARPIEY